MSSEIAAYYFNAECVLGAAVYFSGERRTWEFWHFKLDSLKTVKVTVTQPTKDVEM